MARLGWTLLSQDTRLQTRSQRLGVREIRIGSSLRRYCKAHVPKEAKLNTEEGEFMQLKRALTDERTHMRWPEVLSRSIN